MMSNLWKQVWMSLLKLCNGAGLPLPLYIHSEVNNYRAQTSNKEVLRAYKGSMPVTWRCLGEHADHRCAEPWKGGLAYPVALAEPISNGSASSRRPSSGTNGELASRYEHVSAGPWRLIPNS